MSTAHTSDALREVGSFAAAAPRRPPGSVPHPLAHEIEAAVSTAVDNARARLGSRLPATALDSVHQYFRTPTLHTWQAGVRPEQSASELFADLCASARSVTVSAKAKGLQVELRSLDEAFDVEALGDPVEPDSDVLILSPSRMASAAAKDTSIELRQFDKQRQSWAPFADDLVTVTGADVFLKLFLADGSRSVNGWHADASDVLVTLIHGAKRFAVAVSAPEAPDKEPMPTVDAVLRPGDALRLPRTMLHCATPEGELSALLSMGLMRVGDWSFRHVPPTHLGFRDYPRSAVVYRLCLKSRIAPTPLAAWDSAMTRFRTRIPGGIAVQDISGGQVTFVASGTMYTSSESVVRILGQIHAADGIYVGGLADAAGTSRRSCISIINTLLTHGLIRIEQHTI